MDPAAGFPPATVLSKSAMICVSPRGELDCSGPGQRKGCRYHERLSPLQKYRYPEGLVGLRGWKLEHPRESRWSVVQRLCAPWAEHIAHSNQPRCSSGPAARSSEWRGVEVDLDHARMRRARSVDRRDLSAKFRWSIIDRPANRHRSGLRWSDGVRRDRVSPRCGPRSSPRR